MLEILNLRKTADGFLINGLTKTLQGDGNYQNALDWVADGKEVMPMFTQAELDEIAKIEANNLRDQAMLTGIDYQGSMISLTDVDGNGMLQVKAAFEMGLLSTTIHFKNGTKLPMTAANFSAFALWFVTERNRFFV